MNSRHEKTLDRYWRMKWRHASVVSVDLVGRQKNVSDTSGYETAQGEDVHCTDAARTVGVAVTSAAARRILCCVLLITLREDDASIEQVGENSEQLAQNAAGSQCRLAG